MYEVDVVLTDFAIAAEAAVLALLLVRRQARDVKARTWAVLFFLGLAVATTTGGIVHGFLPDSTSITYRVLWPATLLALGLVSFAGLRFGAVAFLRGRVAAWVETAAAVGFVAYVGVVLFYSQRFLVGIIGYLPAAAFVLAGFFVKFVRTRQWPPLAGALGLFLTFVAAGVQQARIAIHLVYFDHNAFYHLIQFGALLLIFAGSRWIVEQEPIADATRPTLGRAT